MLQPSSPAMLIFANARAAWARWWAAYQTRQLTPAMGDGRPHVSTKDTVQRGTHRLGFDWCHKGLRPWGPDRDSETLSSPLPSPWSRGSLRPHRALERGAPVAQPLCSSVLSDHLSGRCRDSRAAGRPGRALAHEEATTSRQLAEQTGALRQELMSQRTLQSHLQEQTSMLRGEARDRAGHTGSVAASHRSVDIVETSCGAEAQHELSRSLGPPSPPPRVGPPRRSVSALRTATSLYGVGRCTGRTCDTGLGLDGRLSCLRLHARPPAELAAVGISHGRRRPH